MHRLVHSQTLQVWEGNAGVTCDWHLLRIIKTLESYVLRVRSGVDQLNQRVQRKAYPWYNHRPPLNTTMAVDPLFECGDFEHRVEVEHTRFRDRTFDRNCPRDSAELLRVLSGVALRGPELV